ncbi:MAG TPA: chemotaxis protein CheW [Syntrophomonadaceae bacterium]|nr:chemotaxis protein CheW [Syntrophomonadaceae bacterium]
MDNTNEPETQMLVDAPEDLQVVAFRLGKEEYAVNILHVQEINRLLNITRVPRTEKYIKGVVNLRGNIVPVINLHTRFGLLPDGDPEDRRIIVFHFDELKVGVIVDEVSEVLHIKAGDIEETTKVYDSAHAEHIKGVAKVDERLLILLDLKKTFE